MSVEFEQPALLYLLLIVPIWGFHAWPRAGRSVLFSRGESAGSIQAGWVARSRILVTVPGFLRAVILFCVIIALSGPQRLSQTQIASPEGRGITLAVDVSSSMLAADMDGVSRLNVARDAAIRFAARRPNDEIALVGFAGEAFTRIPSTDDLGLITAGVESLGVELVRNGTDLSGAIVTSVARVLESDRPGRVVVLLTDGAHNAAGVQPLAMARAAAAKGVRIHAISMIPSEPGGIQVDRGEETETVLTAVSAVTGGRYFRGATAGAIDSIYREIDRLEAAGSGTVELETRQPVRLWFLAFALLLMAVRSALQGSRWGIVP